MIYTITTNPSIDYVVHLPQFMPGEVNRTIGEQFYPGGKGLNVSIVLKELGMESVALGFVAGFTGDKIEQAMAEMGVKTDFVRVENGCSRINVKLKTNQETENGIVKQESEINGAGPLIEKRHIQSLFTKLEHIQSEDIIILAGSLPKGIDFDFYEVICKVANSKGARVIVDASGEALEHAVKGKPFLVKPNLSELEHLLDKRIRTEEELISCGRTLLNMGVEHVLVSCGKDGAVLVDNQQVIWQKTVDGEIVNTVGSGDSLVAGFLDGWMRTSDWKTALREGVAAGTASAFCQGLANGKQIMDIVDELTD